MSKIHDLVLYVFAGLGIFLAINSPAAGASIAAISLIVGAARTYIAKEDAKRAQSIVDGLQYVVNSNAKRLEQVIVDVEKLSAESAFSQNAARMGLK